jgi:hypothetical protein
MNPAFTKANRYIFDPSAWSWNLPSGWSCPAASECLAKADKESGKISYGENMKFRCYSAMTERYPSVRKRLWANFDAVKGKGAGDVKKVLEMAFPRKARLIRIHSAGDFFSQAYFDGWLEFIRSKEDVRFYAFTKSLPFWINRINDIPPNFVLQASYGGKHDHLISQYNLKFAKVVWSEEEAMKLGLWIDYDDTLAAQHGPSFALLENFTAKKK